jgi:molybdopterin converting factor subunit 1
MNPGISITVLFWGPSRELAGADSLRMHLFEPPTVANLRAQLVARFPNLAGALPAMRIAVNQEFVCDDAALHPNDEVAVIPPVSGG